MLGFVSYLLLGSDLSRTGVNTDNLVKEAKAAYLGSVFSHLGLSPLLHDEFEHLLTLAESIVGQQCRDDCALHLQRGTVYSSHWCQKHKTLL